MGASSAMVFKGFFFFIYLFFVFLRQIWVYGLLWRFFFFLGGGGGGGGGV
jgi:hypothetical protein